MGAEIETEAERVRAIAGELAGQEGPLLPILHALNERLGHVPEPAIPILAELLNISRAEVHGVVSFYHDFRRPPAGRHTVKVCCAESCQSMGSDRLVAELTAALGIALGGTTPDGRVTLEPVYCLGLCAMSPAAMVDGQPVGRADVSLLAELGR